MISKIKEKAKDPKIVAITLLLSILAAENADTAGNVLTNIAQSARAPVEVEPPKIVMEGPETVDEGELIVFTAVESYGDHFTWSIAPEQAKRVSEDSRSCAFASKPGVYEITLFVSNCEGQAIEKRKLTILNTSDCPDVPVNPIPDPEPDPGLTGLAKEVHDLAVSKVEAKYRGDSAKVAKVFRDMSTNSAFTQPQAFADQTVMEVKSALGANTAAWKPWYDALNVALQSRISQGKLITITQYKTAWKQVADGLEAI